ncbi:7TM diverse intracellular signaling domain-containing protein [Hymenobacter convexus]|uniref:7TM diverse intracellular signaling domain-containing protein n=1 Tax=Hymenobacter sp. CA1UV-4 TaxID=3063782 RepID=UPI002713C9D8|nr:7TM diverse intracellular signaling domain-containing protein [Hymenobacter sp. CA1UV-4]MDO7852656.1 7TM diverse intracellular signaling domain-containing protein [Hymenobacter sp. CA1UV-4]
MTKKTFTLLLLFFASLLQLFAQPVPAVLVPAGISVANLGVLPDRGYDWDRIRSDTTLVFGPVDSLRPARCRRYWLKLALTNRSRYAEAYRLTVLPNLDNTLFNFDRDARAWRTRRAGVAAPTDSQRVKGGLPVRLPTRSTTTLYVRVDLSPGATLPAAIRLQLHLEKQAVAQQVDRFYSTAWAVSLTALLLLLLTNLPTYVRYRDRSTLFYLCSQVGAVLYVTAFRGYFKMLWPAPVFSQLVLPDGRSYAYTLNNVAMHLSVVLMLLGFGQMTRAFLLTPARLPRLDAALRYALRGYFGFTVVVALVNLNGFYLNQYSLPYDNLLVLGVVGLLLAIGVVAHQRRLPLAWPFLLANVLPLCFILFIAGYHVFINYDNTGNQLLPDMAILAHALCFSVALSIRSQSLQQTLVAKEREADSLALDIQEKELRNREIVLKNQHIQTALLALEQRQQAREQHAQQLSEDNQQHQATNQELQAQLEANQRELASTSLYVQQKNALLAELKEQIQELNVQRPGQQKELSGIKSILQTNLYLDEDWGRFKLHFEQVHPRFFEELQARYPALTNNEQRLYCYFHIKLATKEIAALLNIDPASVRRAKTRLFKKIAAADLAADLAAGRAPAPAPPDEPAAEQ